MACRSIRWIGYNKVILKGSGIIAVVIYDFCIGKSPLFIGVRGFIVEGLPRITPVRRK
jgi:hypothetical protein